MRRPALSAWIVLGGLFAAAALAESTPPNREPAEPVPLYTNADLERFGPSTAPFGPVESSVPEDWAFVQTFIDRENARLDRENDRLLARRIAEEAAVPPRPRYVAPYAGVYGGWCVYPFRYPSPRIRPAPRRVDASQPPRPAKPGQRAHAGRPPQPPPTGSPRAR